MTIQQNPDIDVLSSDECYRLLSSRSVGRIGVLVDRYPVIVPVNYVLDDRSVIVRTAPGSVVAHADGADVSFQIDEFDVGNRSGWSVLLRGRAAAIGDAEHNMLERVSARLSPWAPGERPLWIRVRAAGISGRRINPTDIAEWRVTSSAYL